LAVAVAGWEWGLAAEAGWEWGLVAEARRLFKKVLAEEC
jgi:hypothetical protein